MVESKQPNIWMQSAGHGGFVKPIYKYVVHSSNTTEDSHPYSREHCSKENADTDKLESTQFNVSVDTSVVSQFVNVRILNVTQRKVFQWVQRLSQDNRIKHRRAWVLLGWVTAERSYPCKRPACPAIGCGSEVTFKPLVPRLSVRVGFLSLTSRGKKLNKGKCTVLHTAPHNIVQSLSERGVMVRLDGQSLAVFDVARTLGVVLDSGQPIRAAATLDVA
ncbi:hypothetical protein J6590_068119 [Homalodisca vitripennis]|nr:hypothetical protein J6590_068119 [Homalodisca vitripennis]